MKSTLRIATRKSPLALWQAEHVKARLMDAHAGLNVELVTFTTKGDKILDTPLAKIGGKGLFVKELETAILEGKADIAAHSDAAPVELRPPVHRWRVSPQAAPPAFPLDGAIRSARQ